MIAVVTGIPGTGKTTVATKAMELLKAEGIEYKMVTYGDVMIEIAKAKKIAEDRDAMRKLDPETQKKIQELAAEKIGTMKGNILVDTHCTIRTSRGFLPGLPEWVLRKLKPNAIILVEASPAEIAGRRNRDKSRTRDAETVEGIALHQDTNRNIAAAYSVFTGATVKVIQNPDNGVEQSGKEMAEVLK
jgi:adenylate kinase